MADGLTKTQLKQPTKIWPGTDEKVALMAQRWEAGISCFQPGDRDMRDVVDQPEPRDALCALKSDWKPQ